MLSANEILSSQMPRYVCVVAPSLISPPRFPDISCLKSEASPLVSYRLPSDF